MFVDIHTHNTVDNQQVIMIIGSGFTFYISGGDEKNIVSSFLSIGIHPWDVNQNYTFDIQEFTKIFENKNVIAVGESGLDKVYKETYQKQIEVFLKMIEVSEKIHKPLIIHAVRSYPEIISIRKNVKAKEPWIIHGFQGSPESARQLISHRMYLSFGEMLYRNENQAVKVLNSVPTEKIFFETDNSGRKISDVYEKAATLMNCDIKYLEKVIFNNFKTIFGDGKLEEQDPYINR